MTHINAERVPKTAAFIANLTAMLDLYEKDESEVRRELTDLEENCGSTGEQYVEAKDKFADVCHLPQDDFQPYKDWWNKTNKYRDLAKKFEAEKELKELGQVMKERSNDRDTARDVLDALEKLKERLEKMVKDFMYVAYAFMEDEDEENVVGYC